MQFFPRRRVRLVEVSENFGAVSTFTGVKGQACLFWGEYLLGPRHLFLSVVSTSLLLLPHPAPPELRLHTRRDRHHFVDLHILFR